MNHFEYRDENGSQLHAEPLVSSDGANYVRITAVDCCDAAVDVDLGRLEEVIAGLRDMARQVGGAPAYRRRLTELEHTAAWHAIEGAAGEDGADPGTVLTAVLRALGIDPSEPADPSLTAIAGTYPPAGDPGCQCEGHLTCDPHLPSQPAETFTVAERQFLSFALDLAFDQMASRGDEFTNEDHAALDRFRRMTTEEAGA